MPKVAFYGDSIATGWHGISATDCRWTSLVSKYLGWTELNFAIDGLGFVRRRGPGGIDDGTPVGLIADITGSDADACVVALGLNDSVIVHDHQEQVRAAIARDLRRLKSRFGSALVVMDLYSRFAGDHPPGWRKVRQLLTDEAARVGLELTSGMPTVINDDTALLCPDGIHPNDAGHAALARSVAPHLQAALAPLTPGAAS
jgi:lysophospholipase L1-like esterase